MEIIIHDKDAYQHSLEKSEILWQLFVRKSQRAILIQYAIGILFIIIAFYPSYDSDTTKKYANNTHQSEAKQDGDSTNIPLVIGIVYIVLVSVSLIKRGKTKQNFMDEAGYRGRIIYKNSNESMVSINEERLKYENPVEKTEWKWAAFENYFLYKDYIVLNFDRMDTRSFAIIKRQIPPETLPDLLNFLRQNIREKKN